MSGLMRKNIPADNLIDFEERKQTRRRTMRRTRSLILLALHPNERRRVHVTIQQDRS